MFGNRSPEVHGQVTAAFAPVREAFAENFSRRGELGASVCMWHQGQKVVDLWAGFQDAARTKAWQEDTITTVFSSTKGMVALCFLMLADRGLMDYEEPVAQYWPEFAAGGKDEISIRTLLNHRSGLVAFDRALTLDAFENRPDEIAEIAAEQEPHWPQDSDQGYHGITYGVYAAVLFERITKESLGSFLRREVCGPLGADFYLGLPEQEESRVSPVHAATLGTILSKMLPKLLFDGGMDGRVFRQVVMGKESARAFGNPAELGPKGVHNFNTRRVHALELPWGNGVGNARALARVYAALANGGEIDGVRIVKAESVAPLLEAQSWSQLDRVLRKEQGWSQGFVKEELNMFSPNAEAFGHPGAGGALGWCDPSVNLAIGYAPNRMAPNVRSPRARALAHAAYRCI